MSLRNKMTVSSMLYSRRIFRQDNKLVTCCALLMMMAICIPPSTLHTTVNALERRSKCPLIVPKEYGAPKALIAHRGASYHVPEHTLEAYRLALELQADYIEVDLVVTKDRHLVAMHSLDLEETTNVATLFPSRQSESSHGNRTGYWVHTFTLAELRMLTVTQRYPDTRSIYMDKLFGIPTFEDILAMMHHWNTESISVLQGADDKRRRAGLYVELKEPFWFKEETGIDIGEVLMEELKSSEHAKSILHDDECQTLKFDEYMVPLLVVESFDGRALLDLHISWNDLMSDGTVGNTTDLPLVLLTETTKCHDEKFWFVNEHDHLSGIGPDKRCLLGEFGEQFLIDSVEHGLAIHPWTMRPESNFFEEVGFNSSLSELRHFWCDAKGVEGLFVEDIATARTVRDLGCDVALLQTQPPSTQPEVSEECKAAEEYEEEILYLGVAAGIMGCLIGCLATYWISTSNYCSRRRRGPRQLSIPSHDIDMEMI